MFELINVTKKFSNEPNDALHNISLSIETGKITVLLGKSGSGKTTLLKMLNQTLLPSMGEIYLNNTNMKTLDPIAIRRSIGYVFQQNSLIPYWTIEDNVATVLRLVGTPRKQRIQRAHALLTCMQLAPEVYAKRYPHQLSGGQQQRVNIARALANDPHCLLMDESFSALDTSTRLSLKDEIVRLKALFNKTIIFVTHNIQEAFALADRIVVMEAGRIVQHGSPSELYHNPCAPLASQLTAQQRIENESLW